MLIDKRGCGGDRFDSVALRKDSLGMALQFVPRFRSAWHPKRRRSPAQVHETLQVLLQTKESVFVATRCCYGM
jgi:hypothetical protein